MWGKKAFFERLCGEYYEKILHYLYATLGDETMARDCTQDVFLVACQKCAALAQHPNPGGFLFQTAKNLAKKLRRESFRRMMNDVSLEDSHLELPGPEDESARERDRQIDEADYCEEVLSRLTQDKRWLYQQYYVGRRSMAEIAAQEGAQEAAIRMRYVRLRREIREIVSQIAQENFEC